MMTILLQSHDKGIRDNETPEVQPPDKASLLALFMQHSPPCPPAAHDIS